MKIIIEIELKDSFWASRHEEPSQTTDAEVVRLIRKELDSLLLDDATFTVTCE